MKIAVVQLSARQGARAFTLQRAIRAFEAAARTDPSPDLVLLPAFSDTAAPPAEADLVCERVHGQSQAALGRAAREWGVYAVYGQLEQSPAAALPYLTAVLTDADGDVRLAQRSRVLADYNRNRIQAGDAFRTAETIFGRVALLAGDDLLSPACWDDAAAADLILGVSCWPAWPKSPGREVIEESLRAQAARVRRPVAVADLSLEDASGVALGRGACAAFDADGRPLAIEADDRGIAWIDVAVTASPGATAL